MIHVLTLVRALGVEWTRAEQEQRLFSLCIQVQATLAQRHGRAYHTTHVSQVPATYGAEAKELVREILPQIG